MEITGQRILESALAAIGVHSLGEPIHEDVLDQARIYASMRLELLALRHGYAPGVVVVEHTLTAGESAYTAGPAGDAQIHTDSTPERVRGWSILEDGREYPQKETKDVKDWQLYPLKDQTARPVLLYYGGVQTVESRVFEFAPVPDADYRTRMYLRIPSITSIDRGQTYDLEVGIAGGARGADRGGADSVDGGDGGGRGVGAEGGGHEPEAADEPERPVRQGRHADSVQVAQGAVFGASAGKGAAVIQWRQWPGALRGSNRRRDRQTACASSVNLAPTALAGGDDTESIGGRRRLMFLEPTPGVDVNASELSEGPVRAVTAAGDRLYVVHADKLSWVSRTGVVTEVDTIDAVKTGPATVAWIGPAGRIAAVAAGGRLAYFDERTETVYRNIRPDIDNLKAVTEFQNYFICLDEDNQVVVSPLLARSADPDLTTEMERFQYDLLNFVGRSLEPDPWIAVRGLGDQLLLWGENTMDVWQLRDNPANLLPIESVRGGAFQAGAVSHAATAVLGDTAYWLGPSSEGSMRVWSFRSGVEPVSTPAVDEWLSYLTDAEIASARLVASAWSGHRTVCVRAGSGASWCWDETSGMWHERGVWDADNRLWKPDMAAFAESVGGKIWLMEETGARIGRMSWTAKDFDGGPIRRQRVTPHFGAGNHLISIRGVKVSAAGGSGRVGLSLSRDGGATFGPERFHFTQDTRWGSTVGGAVGGDGRDPRGGSAGCFAEHALARTRGRRGLRGFDNDARRRRIADEHLGARAVDEGLMPALRFDVLESRIGAENVDMLRRLNKGDRTGMRAVPTGDADMDRFLEDVSSGALRGVRAPRNLDFPEIVLLSKLLDKLMRPARG